jgi:16S rRNA pseudouridine516 synthase
MELERILHSQGFGSRRLCQALISRGAVAVGTTVCTDPHAEFSVDGLEFSVDGVLWPFREKVYLALNKPAGYECSRIPQHHSSVFSLLPEPLRERGVQCVGRLDQDTTGLLLLSDDGQFVHAYTSPKRKVAKIYHATLKHEFDAGLLDILLAGVLLHGESEPLKAVAARQVSAHLLELTIMEGKYHQVKRMVAAAGNRVEALHRHAIGTFTLPPSLAAGAWIWLDPAGAPLRELPPDGT